MTVAARARRVGGFAARFAAAVILAATVTAGVEGVFAARLATQAVLHEGVARVGADASAVQHRAAGLDPWGSAGEALDDLAARPDVLAARVIDRSGTIRIAAGPETAGTALDRATREMSDRAIDTGQAQTAAGSDGSALPAGTSSGGRGLEVVVPTRLDGQTMALEVVLDAGPAAGRAAALRRRLLLMLAVGAAASLPLTLAFGGGRLIGRHRRLARAARRDDLTRLGNRRAFEADLTRAVAAARRQGAQLTLAAVEIGGLGAVNDTVGRRRGDALLVEVAQVLRSGRPGDRAYRLGGDGFALVMPATAAEDALAVTLRLRDRVAAQVQPLTVWVGVCSLDERCPDVETMLIGADSALLEAKQHAGSDRALRRHGGPPVAPDVDSGHAGEVWDIRWLTEGAGPDH